MELIESIECVNDAGETKYVDVYQRTIVHRPIAGRAQRYGGTVEYFSNGQDVTEHGKDAFKVVLTDEILRRVSPDLN